MAWLYGAMCRRHYFQVACNGELKGGNVTTVVVRHSDWQE